MGSYQGTIQWPFGEAQVEKPAYAATIAVEAKNNMVIIEPAILTGNLTLNLTPSSELKAGANVLVKIKTTGTETCTFGASVKAASFAGVAGKTKSILLVFDGTFFIAAAAAVQID